MGSGWMSGPQTYLTLPGQEVRIGPAPVEGDQEVGAAVPVLYGELRIAHLVAGRLCRPTVSGVPIIAGPDTG